MTDHSPSTQGLDEAVRRLDHALARLEVRMSALIERAKNTNGGLFDEDRANLASELDAARGRERDLVEAGSAASAALDRAIAGMRAALGD